MSQLKHETNGFEGWVLVFGIADGGGTTPVAPLLGT